MYGQDFGLSRREVTDILRIKDINPTTQRVEIAHFLLQKPRHFSAEEVFQKLNAEYEQVSQATIYNTLKLFVDRGIIRELIFSSDRIYYDSNVSPHHHFIDIENGTIIDLPDELVSRSAMSEIDADVTDISLVIRGRLRTPTGDSLSVR